MDNNIIREELDDVKALQQRIKEYQGTVKTKDFSDYLQTMLKRIENNPGEVQILAQELDRSYQMYLNRINLMNANVTEKVQEQVVNVDKEPQEAVQPAVEEQFAVDEDTSRYMEFQNLSQNPVQSATTKKKDNEFFVGTVLLSIFGGAFVLTALVMLGMYYMNGFVKGMCLYGGGLALLLVSELFFYKKWPKLGMTFTAISIGELYLTTVLNFISFGNFNMWVAMGITLLITVFVIMLSWKRDSLWYRALGIITCYLCFLVIQKENTMTELIVLTVITFLINLMCIIVPIKQYKTAFRILHMYINGIFTFIINVRFYAMTDMDLPKAIVVLCGLTIMQILLITQTLFKRKDEAAGKNVGKYGIVVAYFISGLFIYAAMPEAVKVLTDGMTWLRYGSFAVMLILVITTMFVLRKGQEIWYAYWGINLMAFHMFCISGEEWEMVIGIVGLLLVSKLLSLLKVSSLRVSDVIITTMCCVMCLGFSENTVGQAAVLVAGVLLSIPFIRYWQTYYEVILTFTLAFFAMEKLPELLQLPSFVGMMFVGILLYNNIKQWQGKHILVFNSLALGAQTICFLLLMNPIYRNEYLVYLCMLIFGLATIVLTFQEKYHMAFKQKNVILAIFLSYMALVVKTDLPIINSILLMLIALICVGMGFYEKEKGIRIYGLVLSFIVCGKMVLYDFFGAVILHKTILFLIVGILALAISGIYIILEKRANTQETNGGERE